VTPPAPDTVYDTVIIGSGFGGSMVAHELVHAGERVLLIERGEWVTRGPHNWGSEGVGLRTPHYTRETPLDVRTDRGRSDGGLFACVGGQSVFYGGASLRFRPRDFEPAPEITGDSGAEWPYDYAELEPYYSRVEQMIRVAGEDDGDPTQGFRSVRYSQRAGELAPISRRVEQAARRLGLRPFRLPLAINYPAGDGARRPAECIACRTCDGYACAIEAKNDLATRVLPDLVARGLELAVNTVAVRLLTRGREIVGVECVDRVTGLQTRYVGRKFVLAAGALASPHLLLASGLERLNPGSRVIGRYLMRHLNLVCFGVFARRPNPERVFDKQIAILDFYYGYPGIRTPSGKLGSIQQLTPPEGLVRAYFGTPLGSIAGFLVCLLSGLLCIAEDQPQIENGVAIDPTVRDRFGFPLLRVRHAYSPRDRAAGAALIRKAKDILREAGALFSLVHPIDTFSHAVGTVRMGTDPGTSALDPWCWYRGVDNLWVVDGSFMPRAGGVNPSLTIAANALRVGEHLAGGRRAGASTRDLAARTHG
jgi:choline dehydrogenase-like flavoprotein